MLSSRLSLVFWGENEKSPGHCFEFLYSEVAGCRGPCPHM